MDGWNELSYRYVDPEDFYVPDVWRSAPESRKQGSGPDLSKEASAALKQMLEDVIGTTTYAYKKMVAEGVAPEQARLVLPAYSLDTTWRWSASLQSVAHFLSQRLEDDAQLEIRAYARVVAQLVRPLFPVSLAALLQGTPLEDAEAEDSGDRDND
jgi:thymidylate synthase (FAD)